LRFFKGAIVELESTTMQTNGIRLHVCQAGPENGPLVILLHGFPEFWYGWRAQIEPLAQAGYRVLVPDQRGYNLSDKPAGVAAYRISELAKDVTGLVEAIGREKAFLVGHDWGAAVAWQTAIQYPDRIEKLAILNVPHPQVMQRFLLRSPRQILKSWYIFFFQLPWLPEAVLRAGDYQGAARALLRSAQAGTFSPQDIAAYKEAWRQPGALTGMIHWYRAIFRSSLGVMLRPKKRSAQGPAVSRRVKPPTLILWGKNDIALSHTMAQPSLELCENGRLVFFENATHWVQHDEAQAVTQQLLEFFAAANTS
jgi:pimeloyl-ACP methyl ester carboxylesterase